jgi:hypothetical protein
MMRPMRVGSTSHDNRRKDQYDHIAYKEHNAILHLDYRELVVAAFGIVIVIDGQIVGAWKRGIEKHRVLARVLRPNGIAAVALMPRYALLRRTLALPDERQHLSDPRWLERLLQHGIFENDIPERFTHGYGAQPAEIEPFFAHYGLQMLTLAASEGIAGGLQAEVANVLAAESSLREVTLDILVQTATDPSILGMASHLLYLGQRIG